MTQYGGDILAHVPAPNEISPKWLSSALSSSLSSEGQRVEVVDFERQPIGTGQVGDTYRYQLTYAEGSSPDLPQNIICKHHAENAESRATARALNLYQNECGFYADLAVSTGVETARPYYVQYQSADDQFILLLEDLAPARMGDQLTGISEEELRLAILQAAKLHASHWGDDRVAALPWVNAQPRAQGVVGPEGTQPFVKQAAAHFADHLSAEHLDVVSRYEQGCFHWNRPLDLPRSITHNDFRADNFLFGTEQGGKPIAVVDWQTTSFHYGPLDIAYLIGSSFVGAQRYRIEQAVIPEYHDALCRHGVRDFSLQQCWESYRYFTVAGLTVAIVASMTVKRTDRGDRLFADMLAHHASHIIEHDAQCFFQS